MVILIQMRHISKFYNGEILNIQALKDISIDIEKKELVSILGEYGSGKNTLFNIIGFIDKPSHGRYFFCGKDTSNLLPQDVIRIRNTYFCFIYSDSLLVDQFTVIQNVSLATKFSEKLSQHEKNSVNEALDIVGMRDRMHACIKDLSFVDKKKTEIAIAIAQDKPIIMFDEPTEHFNSSESREIIKILKRARDLGKTIIIATKDTQLAKQTDRVIHLANGKLVFDTRVN